MVEEPDNLVLQLLRAIRGTLDDHSARFDKLEALIMDVRRVATSTDMKVDALDERVEIIREGTVSAIGYAAHASREHVSLRKEITELARRVERLEARAMTRLGRAGCAALALLAAPALAHEGAHGFSAGAPGDPKAPARTIEIAMSETDSGMAFAPGRIEVRPGEQVRFVLRNQGQLAHEFVLGSKAENAEHAKMMAEMPDMKHTDANAVTVAPGQSATLVWRFPKTGDFEFGCLIPGHYEAGMRGEAVVR